MPNIGPMELAIVAIIALIVFGPSKLPELGTSLGKGMREFKNSISGDDHQREDAEQERLDAMASSEESTEAPETPASQAGATPASRTPADAARSGA